MKQKVLLPNLFSFLFQKWFHLVALSIIGFFVYSNTLWNEYALDDGIVILENRYTKQGIKGIPFLLTLDSFAGFLDEKTPILAGGRYRPLSLISFAIEHSIWGLNPSISHFFNIIFYVLGSFGTYFLLSILISNLHPLLPFLATLIFTLHPIHTEAVANIKGRDELFSWLFLVFSWLSSLYYLRENKTKWLLGCGMSLFLALLSKENGLTALLIFPLSWKLVFSKNSIKSWLPLLAAMGVATGLYIGLRIHAVGLPTTGGSTDILNNPFYNVSLFSKWATISVIFLHYLKLLLFPYPLCFDYSYPQISYHTFYEILPWLSLLLHIALLYYGFYLYKKQSILGFWIFYYFLSLILVSNLLINLGAFLGERLLFQASLGFCIFLAYSILYTWESQNFYLRRLTFVSLLPLLILYAAQTWQRNQDWQNNRTLYIRDVEACPYSCKTNKAAGESYIALAKEAQNKNELQKLAQKAIFYLERSLELYPEYADALLDKGTAHYLLENYEEAEKYWLLAKEKVPQHPILKQNLKILEEQMVYQAHQAFQNKNYTQAIYYMQKALAINPLNADHYYKLGLFLGTTQQIKEAIYYLKKATEMNANHADYWYHLGGAYYTSRQIDSAKWAWKKSLNIRPANQELQKLLNDL